MSEKIILRNSTKYQLTKIIEIFENLAENMTNIFLCGGASDKKKISFRDKLNEYLAYKKNSNVRVFYPEDLFISLMNTDKKQNMLDLENFLVHNSDVVCIIAESVGSFVELGAFVNNEVTKEKVVALVERKYQRTKSFLMLGPIDMLQKYNKDSVIFYKVDEVEKIGDELLKLLRRRHQKLWFNGLKLDTIVGMSYYILLILYFYERVDFNTLKKYVEFALNSSSIKLEYSVEILLKASLKLLFKEKQIIKNANHTYSLSIKGIEDIRNLLGIELLNDLRSKKRLRIHTDTRLYDELKFDIMRDRYYS
jgi:hypothetical protein